MVGLGLLFICKLEAFKFMVIFIQVLTISKDDAMVFFLAGRSNQRGRKGIEHFLLHL